MCECVYVNVCVFVLKQIAPLPQIGILHNAVGAILKVDDERARWKL